MTETAHFHGTREGPDEMSIRKNRGADMDKIVITIARYYGSGGKTIGEMLGEELGIPFYNREILRMASDDSGISEALFAQADEKLKKTTLFRVAHKAYDGTVIPPESKDFLSNQNLFNYQAKVIRALADEHSCIIIGRCGDYVLSGRDNLIRVFIYADPDYCLEQAKKICHHQLFYWPWNPFL
jgi:hypothetical protein